MFSACLHFHFICIHFDVLSLVIYFFLIIIFNVGPSKDSFSVLATHALDHLATLDPPIYNFYCITCFSFVLLFVSLKMLGSSPFSLFFHFPFLLVCLNQQIPSHLSKAMLLTYLTLCTLNEERNEERKVSHFLFITLKQQTHFPSPLSFFPMCYPHSNVSCQLIEEIQLAYIFIALMCFQIMLFLKCVLGR